MTQGLAPDRALYDAWQSARARGLNNRAAALEAGVSEAELIASACGRGVTRLSGKVFPLLQTLSALGTIKSVIRNAFAVQERTGHVLAVDGDAAAAIVHGDTFEVHGQLSAWTRAFALTEPGKHGTKRSLQFFTRAGTSAAKFFLTSGSDKSGYAGVVERFAANDQGDVEPGIAVAETSPEPTPAQLVAGSLAGFLHEASRLAIPVEIVVANDAASQITVKVLERIKRSDRGGWINVLDEGLDLHLHEDRIENVQIVRSGTGVALRWFADDGREALATRVETHGGELAAAAASE